MSLRSGPSAALSINKLHPIIIKSVGKLPYFHFILFTLKTYVAFQSTFMNAAGKSVSFKKHD